MSDHAYYEELEAKVTVEKCKVCGGPVLITINRGSGVCSENCRKVDRGEATVEK